MHRYIHLILTGLLIMSLGTTAVHAKQTSSENGADSTTAQDSDMELVKLSNGLSVLVKEDKRFPLVNVRLYVHAGSAYEKPEIAGISHQLEHMVFKGTEKRAPGAVAKDIESVGGELNAATSFDYTVYYVEVPSAEWKLGMDVVEDMVFHAALDPEELKMEKEVVQAERQRSNDTPQRALFNAVQKKLWKGTSYEWPIIGYEETIDGYTSEKINKYISEFYQPQSMLLCVVGDVNKEEVLKEAERLYGDMKNNRTVTPTVPFTPPTGTGPQVEVIPGKWNKVYMNIVFPAPAFNSAEVAGLDVLCEVLGGSATSRFYRKFKYEKMLVDTIGVSAMNLERSGMIMISASMDRENLTPFWQELLVELGKVNPMDFTDQEIDRQKLNIEDSHYSSRETISGLASKLGYYHFFEDGIQSEENYLTNVRNADRKEMTAMYKKYFRPENMTAGFIVPEKELVDATYLEKMVPSRWKSDEDSKQISAADKLKETTEIELAGGSKLVLIPDETMPYTAMSMRWNGGDTLIEKEEQGLPIMAARVLTRGTEKRTVVELQDFFADHATSMGANAGRKTFSFTARFPSRFTDDVLPVMEEVLTQPAWPTEELQRSKADQVAAIVRKKDQALGLAFRNLFPFLFDSEPFNIIHDGTKESIGKISTGDLKEFWKEQYSKPFVLAVCGDFDAKRIEEYARSLTTKLHTKEEKIAEKAPQWGTQKDLILTLEDREQSHLLVIFPTVGSDSLTGSAEQSVMRATLAGQSGLLFRDLRDKQGLGYTVTAIPWQTEETGFLALYIGTEKAKGEQALEGFKKAVKNLQDEPLPEEELNRAKNVLVGEYVQDTQALLARSGEASSQLIRGHAIDHSKKVIDQAKEVTPADLQDFAKKYLNWEKAYFLTVQP
ncbi:MAG: M16 family metallopeptidase [Desulfovibrio sp.]